MKSSRNSFGMMFLSRFIILQSVVTRYLFVQKVVNCCYVICGSGNLLEKNKLLAKKLGVEKQVIFTGYRKDVAIFYHMADLFLFPSYREGLSLALMEAMVNKLPVICSDIRGNCDLVDDGWGGYRLSEINNREWQVAIENMLCQKLKGCF